MAKPRVSKSLQHSLDATPTAYVACRVANERHRWTLAALRPHSLGIERWHWCPRCKTNRFQVIRRDGTAAQSRYDYPRGYSIEGVKSDSSGNQTLRLEYNRRMLESGSFVLPDEIPKAWADGE